MRHECPRCGGAKNVFIVDDHGVKKWTVCPLCVGRGWISEAEKAAVDKIVALTDKAAGKMAQKIDDYVRRMGKL